MEFLTQIHALSLPTLVVSIIAVLFLVLFIVQKMKGIRMGEEFADFHLKMDEMAKKLALGEENLNEANRDMLELRVNDAKSETTIASMQARIDDKQRAIEELNAEIKTLSERNERAAVEYGKLKTQMTNDKDNFDAQKASLEDAKVQLKHEFENMANRIFEQKGQQFSATSEQSINAMLQPFKEQIAGFQQRVNEVHESTLKDSSSLNAQIKQVLDIGMQMSEEANNLSKSLKGDSQQRGAWGEAQLERTLEMSGLMPDEHYEKQSSFKDAEGKRKQTDYLIKLPDEKAIIIDSKVTMVAYDKAVNAGTPELEAIAMKEHVAAVRRHIDDLASKDYTNLIGMQSPSFVLMFMPIEPAYIDALKSNKDLFEYGYNKGIVLVSHTTLIPILKTVSNLWMIDRSNKEARVVAEKAGEIFNAVSIVAERVQKIGGTLATASRQYNDVVRAVSGNQGLYGKVDRFNTLSEKVSKSLPTLEESHLDFESERLDTAVNALPKAIAIVDEVSEVATPEYVALSEQATGGDVSEAPVAEIEASVSDEPDVIEDALENDIDEVDADKTESFSIPEKDVF